MSSKSYNNTEEKRSSLFNRQFTVMLGVFFTFITFSFYCTEPAGITAPAEKWVGTWGTAPQLVEPHNNPPAPGLSNNTLRQIVCVSIGGENLRIRFSNEFSKSPVTMHEVHIALSADSNAINPATDLALKFNGKPEVTMAPGAEVTSDPFKFPLKPRSLVTITIYFGETSPEVTGHPGSRTTSYILTGNSVSAANFSGSIHTDHWYVIHGIDVIATENAAAVVTLGNSITDGRGSGTNKQNRWPDILAARFLANEGTQQTAVLNMGIGGNCVLHGGLGPTALVRFNRDVIKQNGVRWLILLEGINDIGTSRGAEQSAEAAKGLIEAYGKMIDSAHAAGIRVYGVTILPFAGSFYDSPEHQAAWKTVNDWIRTSGRFDAVIDLDAAMSDPANPGHLLPAADTGDHLHPNETGYKMMGEAIDLKLFK